MLRSLAGTLLLAMILTTIFKGLVDPVWSFDPALIAGVCAWLAAVLLFASTSRALQIQVTVLIVLGAGLMTYVALTGGVINLPAVLTANTGLLSMIAAVGFLRLVALPEQAQVETLPRGAKAYLQTITGLNLISSIINISAPIIYSDRIHRVRPLDRLSIQSFTRVFCAASSWSPFFAATAVVLTYVEDAQLSKMIIYGIPFTIAGVLLTMLEARVRYKPEVENFVGYPTQVTALVIPLLLVIAVGGFTLFSADTPILVILALCPLLITLGFLVFRLGPGNASRRVTAHVTQGLPSMQNELCLFLAAGVLATGISAMITAGQLVNPLPFFDHRLAGLLLLAMLLMSVIGIHPVIQISSMTGLIMQLNPDPSLLAAVYLFAWHIGTCSSPLSGTNLVFQGRYGVPAWRIAYWNLPYGLVMVVFGGLWLWLAGTIFA